LIFNLNEVSVYISRSLLCAEAIPDPGFIGVNSFKYWKPWPLAWYSAYLLNVEAMNMHATRLLIDVQQVCKFVQIDAVMLDQRNSLLANWKDQCLAHSLDREIRQIAHSLEREDVAVRIVGHLANVMSVITKESLFIEYNSERVQSLKAVHLTIKLAVVSTLRFVLDHLHPCKDGPSLLLSSFEVRN
jgi:hypothetical protein